MNRLIFKHSCNLAAAGLVATAAFAASPAMAQGGRWITTDDYPSKAMREGRDGTVKFRLVINENGKPESCEIVESSGSQDLDEAACSLIMRRAKFNPAMQNGKPVKATWVSTFRWVIPRD